MNDSRKFWKIIKSSFQDQGMNSNKMMVIEKDRLLSKEESIAEVMNNCSVDISKKSKLEGLF